MDLEMETELEPKVRAITSRARTLGQAGQTQEAASLLKEASHLAGKMAILHADIGRVYADLGLFAEAMASFERGRQLEPDNRQIAEDQAEALRLSGQHFEAAEVLRETIARNPRCGRIYANLGQILEEIGRIDDAREIYDKGVARCGRGARQPRGYLLERLCHLEMRQGRLQAALDYAIRGVEATPTNMNLCRVACEIALALHDVTVFRELSPCLLRRGSESDRVWVQDQLRVLGP